MRTVSAAIAGLFGLAVSLLLPAPAAAGPAKFHRVPGAAKTLQMRTVAYDGSTNGRMVVEVQNTAKTEQTFEAAGLYFVPEADPKEAPQRLGAAGPFELVTARGASGEPLQKLSIAPGATVRLELHVFCIDSHRSSPTSETPFAVAKRRMPKALRTTIQSGTTKILRRHKGKVAPKATSEIQSHVWETRDADWIELEGERAGEKALKQRDRQRPHRQEQRRHPPRRHK